MRRLVGCFMMASLGFAGCNFPAPQPQQADAGWTPPTGGRKIVLTITNEKVEGPLMGFPLYVDITSADLAVKLDAGGTKLSFRTPDGVVLPHELQRYRAVTGGLQAWVKVPVIEAAPGQDTYIELWYGKDDLAAAPNPAEVWRDYYAVFHLEVKANGASSILNSAMAGSPGNSVNLDDNDDLVTGQLGNAYDFDGGLERFTFNNPISGGVASTMSAWIKQRSTNDNDVVLSLGVAAANNGRLFFSRFSITEVIASELVGDLGQSSSVIVNQGMWRLVHWSYATVAGAGQGALYLSGAPIAASIAYAAPATTSSGGLAHVGHADAAFGANLGAKAELDEVRIAKTALSPAWIKAEYANQSSTTFLVVSPPQDR